MGSVKTSDVPRLGALLLVALALAACSDDDPPPRSAGDAAVDADAALASDAPSGGKDVPVVPAALGAACEEDRGCQSGFCADSVCCASACAGGCRRCDLAGQVGQCSLEAIGAPCGGDLCKDLVTYQPPLICDGAGRCLERSPISCAPARCLDDFCVTTCTRNDECDPPAVCQAGTCGRGLPATADAGSDAPSPTDAPDATSGN